MKTQFVSAPSQKANCLILYCAGWGTPPSAVAHLTLPEQCDLLICYGYQQLKLDFDCSAYQHIHLVAWSMGVWVAEQLFATLPLTTATAINGTPLPCDEQYGIPPAVFIGTLNGLNADSRQKFERRMCGDAASFEQYQKLPEHRPFSEIQQELTALYQGITHSQSSPTLAWSKAIIGTQDRIFPTSNQQAYWQQQSPHTTIQILNGGHYLLPHFHTWDALWAN